MSGDHDAPRASVPAPPPGPLTAQLLIDLVTSPLDPGYAAAYERRGGAPPEHRTLERVAVAAGALLIGFVLVLAYVHTHRSAPATAKAHSDLVSRVRVAEGESDQLQAQVQSIQAQIDKIRNAAIAGGTANAIARGQLIAGGIAARGPGLQVTLNEPPAATASPQPGRGGTSSLPATNILTDRDVRSVVNELWADGAEAIAVNNIRLTPTSAIRFAGEAVLVDLQPVTPPYVIRAIGDIDTLATNFASSAVASRYQTLVSADHITFAFTEHSSMTLPAGSESQLRYARPANGSGR